MFDETLAGENPNYKLLVLESTIVREDIRALADSPDSPPPPHDPDSGKLVLFFSDVNIQDFKVNWGLKIKHSQRH